MEDPDDDRCPTPPCRHQPQCKSLLSRSMRMHVLGRSEKFAEYFDVDADFINRLIARCVINTLEKDKIKKEESSSERCSTILSCIVRKTWGHLRRLCHILHDRDEAYLLREVFNLTLEATVIEPSASTVPDQNVTTRVADSHINEVRDSLKKTHRERFYKVKVFGSKYFELMNHYIDVQLTEVQGVKSVDRRPWESEMFTGEGVRAEFGDNYQRVLVTGPTGCGKTALCLHIAAQWAMDNKTPHFNCFKLVVYLEASVVLKYGLKQALQQQLPRKPNYTEATWSYMWSHGENCLVIIDDLDTILLHAKSADPAVLSDIEELLDNKLFYGCWLLATASRELARKHSNKFTRQLQHDGFSKKQAYLFIEKFFVNNKTSFEGLKRFMDQHKHSKRRLEELIRRPIWNLVLCRLWELSGQVKGRKLNATTLYVHMEEALVGHRPTLSQMDQMRHLYQLCLHSLMHQVNILDRNLIRQFNIPKRSIAFNFLTKKDFVTNDLYEDYGFVVPHRTLLAYFAAKEVQSQQKTQCQWILLNILLHKERFSEIVVFLTGLSDIPNLFDLVLMHTVFHQSVKLDRKIGHQCLDECGDAVGRCQSMMSDLYKESSKFLLTVTDNSTLSTALLNVKQVRRDSFAQNLRQTDDISCQITQMVTDVQADICSCCFQHLFQLALPQYEQIVWLLRCYHEHTTTQKSSILSPLMAKTAGFLTFMGTDSPYDFLISEFTVDTQRCVVKAPYATSPCELQVLGQFLSQHDQRKKPIHKLSISIGSACNDINISGKNNNGVTLAKEIRDALCKLYNGGLSELSIEGLSPLFATQILPTPVCTSLSGLTMSYFSKSNEWVNLLKHLSKSTIELLQFEALDFDGSGVLQSIVQGGEMFCENISMMRLGHRVTASTNSIHSYLLHGHVNVTCENLILGGSTYCTELTYEIDPLSGARSLYVTYGEAAVSMKGLLPSGIHLDSVLLCKLCTADSLSGLLTDVVQDGVSISSLQIDHLYRSGFILQALSDHCEQLAEHLSTLCVMVGIYTADDIREWLMCHATSPAHPAITLQSPTIDNESLGQIHIEKEDNRSALTNVKFSYISGRQVYVSCLPADVKFGSVTFSGLRTENLTVWHEIIQNVSQCHLHSLNFLCNTYANGDPVLQAFLQNILCLRRVGRLALHNFLFMVCDMLDLISIANVIPLTLHKVEIGQLNLDHLHVENADDGLKQVMTVRCYYPQDFSDLLPITHQLENLTLTLHTDYSKGSPEQQRFSAYSQPNSSQRDQLLSQRGKPASQSKKQNSPSSIPDSLRSSGGRSLSPVSGVEDGSSPVLRRRSVENTPGTSFTDDDAPSMSNISDFHSTSPHSTTSVHSHHSTSPHSTTSVHSHHSTSPHSTTSMHSRGRKSRGGSSHYASSGGTNNLSCGTQPDSANSLMKEIEKGYIDSVTFDLCRCEDDACEDILQALTDHSEQLHNRIGCLSLITSDFLSPTILHKFMQCSLAARTNILQT